MMSLTYFIQKDCVQMLLDSSYNHENNEKGKDINMQLKPCLYTQTNVMTFIDNQLSYVCGSLTRLFILFH